MTQTRQPREWCFLLGEKSQGVYRELVAAPGKYENLPEYAPYYWEMAQLGIADESFRANERLDSHGLVHSFLLNRNDFDLYPILGDAGVLTLYLWEGIDGKVHIRADTLGDWSMRDKLASGVREFIRTEEIAEDERAEKDAYLEYVLEFDGDSDDIEC